MRHRALILLALSFLLASCDPLNLPVTPTPTSLPPTAIPEPTPTVEAPIPIATAKPPGAPTVGADALKREVTQIEEDASELRGLEPKEDVPEEFITQEQLRANLAEEIKKEYSREEARRDTTLLWLLRLIDDPSIDLYQLQIDLLGEQVLGYYDHEEDELFVRKDQAELSPLARMTVAHEFVHSLQDQHFDLDKLRPEEIESDKGMAVLSLIEGDATVSGIAYAQKYMSSEDFQKIISESESLSSNVLDEAPRYIRESLTFPYSQGPLFVTALVQAQPGSFKGINDALADPPVSSEQILHPQKYLREPRDEPLQVEVPALTGTLSAGWTYGDGDTLGEFDLKMLLEENGTMNFDASEGWGGARYALYQKGEDGVVLTITRWDTEDDAAEFNDAMKKSLASLEKDGELWSDGKRYFGLAASGDRVVFAGGTDRTAVQSAMSAKP